jgi:hypothetical protein
MDPESKIFKANKELLAPAFKILYGFVRKNVHINFGIPMSSFIRRPMKGLTFSFKIIIEGPSGMPIGMQIVNH